jgi:hypothetical protein
MNAQSGAGVQRVEYWKGQLLASRDLRDDSGFESSMRAIHFRALHDTWGVALGLVLGLDTTTNRVTVGAGFAYDCRGLAIILSSEATIGAPHPLPLPSTCALLYDLVCSYAPTDDPPNPPPDGVTCAGTGPVERPRFRWALAGDVDQTAAVPIAEDVRLGEEIPLGRFLLGPDGTLSDPDPSVRRNARPLLRPHFGCSAVKPKAESWSLGSPGGRSVLVDTTEGGFSSTPLYFVVLTSNPWANAPGDVGPFVSVAEPKPDSFRLWLLFGDPGSAEPLDPTDIALFWMGVEPVSGCSQLPSSIELIP